MTKLLLLSILFIASCGYSALKQDLQNCVDTVEQIKTSKAVKDNYKDHCIREYIRAQLRRK